MIPFSIPLLTSLNRFYAKYGKTHKGSISRFIPTRTHDGITLSHLSSGTNHNTGKKTCGTKGRLRGLHEVDTGFHKTYIKRIMLK